MCLYFKKYVYHWVFRTYHFIPPRDLRTASMGRCGHALVAVTLCCVCGFVAGIDLDEVMAALPAEARALLSKQNAEVTKMTDTICASALRRT